MSKALNISQEELLYQVKISCQIPNLLRAIATRKIIIDTAKEADIKVEIKEVQQAADNLRLANNLVKAEDTWTWLEKHHLSIEDFEGIAYTDLLAKKLALHLFGDKVEQFFYEHQLDYAAAVTYEVILDDEDLACELFYALKEKEISFYEIAHQYIQDIELRRVGGYQGIKKRTGFSSEMCAAVFAANPPEILKPIVTSKGVHLIFVEEIIKPELNDQLRGKILGNLFTDWLNQQIAEMEVIAQINLDNSFKLEITEIKSL
ncbi:peptidylprolyl isomerase, partial [Aetokthonos hydrillicola]